MNSLASPLKAAPVAFLEVIQTSPLPLKSLLGVLSCNSSNELLVGQGSVFKSRFVSGHDFQRSLKNLLSESFVSGHEFTRAEKEQKRTGLQPLKNQGLAGAKARTTIAPSGTAEESAEKLDCMRCSGRAGLQARVQALYFCHPERTSVREGSAFSTFSAACEAMP
jgi:hypothetical protein